MCNGSKTIGLLTLENIREMKKGCDTGEIFPDHSLFLINRKFRWNFLLIKKALSAYD